MAAIHKSRQPTAQAGDLIQLITEKQRHFIFTLTPGETFQSHNGIIAHDDLIGLTWGSRVKSHIGKMFALLQPQLDEVHQEDGVPNDDPCQGDHPDHGGGGEEGSPHGVGR